MPKVEIKKPTEDRIENYIRVGTNYFKIINKPDRFGIDRLQLKTWKKDEIKTDFDNKAPERVTKYDDFVLVPDNINYSPIVNNCYNLYSPFHHKPKQGEWPWTQQLLRHVFGDQYDLGLIYLKVLYENPAQTLPVLVLVSKERVTGKSTFLDWMNIVFGANMVQIEPDALNSPYNGSYAVANIIAIDETLVEKQAAAEKVKSLATKKFLMANYKWISEFQVPCFFKIIMATNNEKSFMKIDNEEVRFWIRKLKRPAAENHNILNDMVGEIPAFLHALTELPPVDYSRSRMVLTPEQITNDELKAVKEESHTWLYHDLKDNIQEWFDNNSEKQIQATVGDIKTKYYLTNHKVTRPYIRKVLKEEFDLETPDKPFYYWGFDGRETGRAYTFKREIFTDEPGIDNEEKEADKIDSPF